MGFQMQVIYLEGEENTTRGVDETRERRQPIKVGGGVLSSQLQPWVSGVQSHGVTLAVNIKYLPPSYHAQGMKTPRCLYNSPH